MMSRNSPIRVVAAIDFGTTFSGFALAHKSNHKEIYVHNEWETSVGSFKTPTILHYDASKNVISWGHNALPRKPKKKKSKSKAPSKIFYAERFKLCLGGPKDSASTFLPILPDNVDHKKAITDYLQKIGEKMKDKIDTIWPLINYHEQVLVIMTIPTEFDGAINTMRECAFKAGLIEDTDSQNLKFVHEPEAAAVYCLKNLKENIPNNSTFLVVDSGGGTVDLTARKVLPGGRLCEKTISEGDFCGGSFVDEEFLKLIGQKVGNPSAIELIRDKHYGQLQYMVQKFCRAKYRFTGEEKNYEPLELDLNDVCPVIKQYAKGTEGGKLEDDEWVIEFTFEEVKEMFDLVIEKIFVLIERQLDACKDISAIFLVGGFSESKYLQTRIKQKFNQRVKNKISVPPNPIAAVVKGAVLYGLRNEVIATRKLKWTYGTDVCREWELGDPHDRRLPGNRIIEFMALAKRGDEVDVNEAVSNIFHPGFFLQDKVGFDVYITDKDDVKYCDPEKDDVTLLRKWIVDVPVTFTLRPIEFILCFGEHEIEAIAFNLATHTRCNVKIDLDI